MPGELGSVRKMIVRALVVAVLASSYLVAVGQQPADAGTRAPERRMVELINRARVSRGLAKLTMRTSLTYRARRHSGRMASTGGIFHSNLRTTLKGLRWRVAGENVGMGPTIPLLHRAFMNSPGHRANILYRRYRNVGVGVVTRNGVIFVTVLFTG